MTKQPLIHKFNLIPSILREREYLRQKSASLILSACCLFLAGAILRINFVIPLFLFTLILYLKIAYDGHNRKNYNLLYLSFLFVIIFSISLFIIRQHLDKFYIPFSAIPMLAIILFGEPIVTLLLILASSFSITVIAGGDFRLGILFLISGIISVILLRDVRRRIAVVRAGLCVGLIQAITLFFVDHFTVYDLAAYSTLFLNGVASSIIVVGILPVFEYLFKTATNISLLELTDFNHPLLQRMIIEAPGTYHHSLIVGNLSEAACLAVGAHSLMARIGSYYHDIGKLQKPDYFSENQNISANKHDDLAPTMSKLVIMNHVKEGEALARQYKLSPVLSDFIAQHHGTSLVYYFYRRALENLEEEQEIKEEGFRYPGPKPKSKEVAIVLLADSVEAATRALKDPTPAKIEELVRKIMNNKFIDGQLDECDLTLRELEKISAVFSRILSAIYHSRINYPEQALKK